MVPEKPRSPMTEPNINPNQAAFAENPLDSPRNPASFPPYLFEELNQSAGVDYKKSDIADNYETRHTHFRDFQKEFELIRTRISLTPDQTVLDMGCGTGAFVIPASEYCRHVYAADASQAMLHHLQSKIASLGRTNVTVCHGGFLTYEHRAAPVDAVLTSLALHHLPDFWKAVALHRLASMLKPDGYFYLFDVVFHFPIETWQTNTESLLQAMASHAGREAFTHIQKEFSTFDWILEGMLQRTGFCVEQVFDDLSFCRAYVCRRLS